MTTVILKNTHMTNTLTVRNLPLRPIAANSQIDISGIPLERIYRAASETSAADSSATIGRLGELIERASTPLTINDGTSDLTVQQAQEYLEEFNSTQIRNDLNVPPEHWRGAWNSGNTYVPGDMVRQLSEGEERIFIATTAIASGQPAPPTGPAIGAWLEIDVKQSRGVWNNEDRYRFGDVVSHNSNYWMAIATIADDQPAPSPTNTNYIQLNPRAGEFRTISYVRGNRTLTATDEYIIHDDNATTITIPATDSSILDGKTWLVENKDSRDTGHPVPLAAGTGVTISANGVTTIGINQLARITIEAVEGSNDIAHVSLFGVPIQYQYNGVNQTRTTDIINITGNVFSGTNDTTTGKKTWTFNGDVVWHNFTTYSATSQQLFANVSGTLRNTAPADATWTLPAGLSDTDEWVSFLGNDTNFNLTVNGTFESGNTSITLIAGKGQIIYWNGTAFGQGTVRDVYQTVASFPDFPVNNLDRGTAWSNNGQSGTLDSNGVNFVGATDAEWLGFRNTTSRWNFSAGSLYVLDWQTYDNASVGDGMIIANVFGSQSSIWVRPSNTNSETFVMNGTTYTHNNPLVIMATEAFSIIRSTTANQWDVQTAVVGLSGGQGAGGQTGNQFLATRIEGSNYSLIAKNRQGSAVKKGEFAHRGAKGGELAAVKSTAALRVMGIFEANAEDGEITTILYKGEIPEVPVWNNNGYITAPLADDAQLYFDTVDHRPNTDPMDGSVTRVPVGKVISSVETMTTEVARTLGTNYPNSASGEVQLSLNKVNEFTGTGTSDFSFPSGFLEGIGGFVEVVDGVRIALKIDESSGIVNAKPGPNVSLKLKSNEAVEYTDISPLVMDASSNVFQYRFYEYRESDNTWLALENGEDAIKTTYDFDISRFNFANVNQGMYEQGVLIQNNTQNVSVIKNWPKIPITTDFDISNNYNVVYTASGHTDHSRTINITTGHNLASNTTGQFVISNANATYWIKIINDGGNFLGTSTNEIWIKPRESRQFIRLYDGVTESVEVIGSVFYDFTAEAGVLGGPTSWTLSDIDEMPTDIIEIPGANTDRIEFKYPGTVKDIQLSCQWAFTGTPAADYASKVNHSMSIGLEKNGSSIHGGLPIAITNETGDKDHSLENIDYESVVANDYFTVSKTGPASVSGSSVKLKATYVIKKA